MVGGEKDDGKGVIWDMEGIDMEKGVVVKVVVVEVVFGMVNPVVEPDENNPAIVDDMANVLELERVEGSSETFVIGSDTI